MRSMLGLGILLALLLPLAGCHQASHSSPREEGMSSGSGSPMMMADDDDEDEDEDDEVDVALDQVPQAIKDAAAAAVPGMVMTGAERETENGKVVYGIEGTLDGTPVEVEVTADGQVLEIETGADDDDD
ncbi:MAG: hypothetical protein KDC38_07300 [Planctomycetes bacterium]|nr:hypothetical protein [Planctomycetota bacterium]